MSMMCFPRAHHCILKRIASVSGATFDTANSSKAIRLEWVHHWQLYPRWERQDKSKSKYGTRICGWLHCGLLATLCAAGIAVDGPNLIFVLLFSTHLFLALLVVMHVNNGRHHSSTNRTEQDRSCAQANCRLAHAGRRVAAGAGRRGRAVASRVDAYYQYIDDTPRVSTLVLTRLQFQGERAGRGREQGSEREQPFFKVRLK